MSPRKAATAKAVSAKAVNAKAADPKAAIGKAVAKKTTSAKATDAKPAAQGIVEALYIAAAQDRVWLVMRADTEEDARQAVASLPLHAYATVEYATLTDPM